MTRLASKRLVLVGLVLLAAAVLSGCGRGKGRARQVVAYAAEKEEIVQAVSRMWEKAAPDIQLSVIAAGTNEVVQRVRAERQQPLGDLIWGVGPEGPSANPELYEAYKTSEAKAVAPRWTAAAKDEPWQPNNIVPLALIYNTRLVTAAQAPRAWRDLAAPQWKGTLAYAAPDKSGSAYRQLAVMVSVFADNDAGWKTIERIMANSKILPASGKVPKGVADGEYAVGMTYENVAGLYVRGGAHMKIVYPAEGTAVLPDANALIRNAPHPEEAKRFLDFLQSKPVQEMLAKKLSLRSCRTDVATPPGLVAIDTIKAAPKFDFRWAVKHRRDFIEKWRAIVLRLEQ